MRTRWFLAAAMTVGLGLSMPADALAQGNSASARGRQDRPQPAGVAQERGQRDTRGSVRERRDRDDDRDDRGRADRQRQRDEVRLRSEHARQRELERQRAWERQREWERRQREWERQRAWERQREWERQRAWHSGRQLRPGPSFCRDGSGHPVFGRQWCRDKGFALGSARYGWERRRWDDIVLRQPRRRYDGYFGRSVLGEILGDVVLGRFETYGRQHYGQGDIFGQWYDDADVAILELSIGGVPFARLVDTNRSGRIGTVLFRQ